VQKGARTPFPRIPIPLHPWKQAVISQAICIGKTLAHKYNVNTLNLLAKAFSMLLLLLLVFKKNMKL